MSSNDSAYISFGVQAGDKEANAAVSPHYLELRKLLAEKCSRGYGPKFKEMAFVLRIDGAIWHWGKSGCDNLQGKKRGEATVDIFMPMNIWQQGEDEIRDFLVKETSKGFILMLDKLLSLGVSFNQDELASDFDSAIKLFSA